MQDDIQIRHFQQLYDLIKLARSRSLVVVNREHLNLFWQVGAFIEAKLSEGSWGDKVVDQFSEWLKQMDPSVKNFDRRNIYRMRTFFLAYSSIQMKPEKGGAAIEVSEKPQLQDTLDQAGQTWVIPNFQNNSQTT